MINPYDALNSPKVIYEELNKTVIGQDAAKKKLAIVAFMYRLFCLLDAFDQKTLSLPKPTTLITGKTGTGKTLLVSELGEILNCDVLHIAAPSLSNIGWSGSDINDVVGPFILKTNGFGIVFIDEFDKLCKTSSGAGQARDWYMTLQQNLLSMIDGVPFKGKNDSNLDPSKLLFILGGSFENFRKDSLDFNDGAMGFDRKIGNKVKTKLNKSSLEQAGVIRELLSRISFICETKMPSRESIKSCILNMRGNIIKRYVDVFTFCDLDYIVSEKSLDIICDKVRKGKYGMRAIEEELLKIIEKDLFNLEDGSSIVTYSKTLLDRYEDEERAQMAEVKI